MMILDTLHSGEQMVVSFNKAAQISAEVDGTPSDGTDMPGALVFKTSADASDTPSERLRIGSTGVISHTNFNGIGLSMSGSGDPTIRIQDADGTNQYGDFAHNGGDTYIVTRNNESHGEFVLYSNDGTTTKNRLTIKELEELKLVVGLVSLLLLLSKLKQVFFRVGAYPEHISLIDQKSI